MNFVHIAETLYMIYVFFAHIILINGIKQGFCEIINKYFLRFYQKNILDKLVLYGYNITPFFLKKNPLIFKNIRGFFILF